ncbi:MAG TPA: hypothetical protein VFO34_11130 [Candidatus Acidoferrales bacterium]|nr:hypothetical protein [Candidatus Acidoferrales bacterium]
MIRRVAFWSAVFVGVTCMCLGPNVHAQGTEEQGRGPIWYESVMGSSSSLGVVTRFDSVGGYNFSNHFGADFGLPILFVHASSSTTGLRSANGIGDVYGDLRFTFNTEPLNYVSTITATAPTGDPNKGFSSGRATVNWNNLFDRSFGALTPYANVGIGNSILDTTYFVRPYTTLGFVAHVEGGASYRVWRAVSVHASGYVVEPSGQQKVFSKLINKSGGAPGKAASHGRVFTTAPETVGTSAIDRDRGVSLGVDTSLNRVVNLSLGYTHSFSYALDTVYFGLGFNVSRAIRRGSN